VPFVKYLWYVSGLIKYLRKDHKSDFSYNCKLILVSFVEPVSNMKSCSSLHLKGRIQEHQSSSSLQVETKFEAINYRHDGAMKGTHFLFVFESLAKAKTFNYRYNVLLCNSRLYVGTYLCIKYWHEPLNFESKATTQNRPYLL
jgi:hypothetical protein